MMAKLDKVEKSVADLSSMVKDLNDIAQKCFDQMLKDNVKIHELEGEVKSLKAEVQLLKDARA